MKINTEMMYTMYFLLFSAFPFNCIIRTEKTHGTESTNLLVIWNEKLHLKTLMLSFTMDHLQINSHLSGGTRIIKVKIYF